MTIDSAYDTLTTKDVSLSLWDSVLVRIIQERCPNICGTLSASFKNLVPDWQESSVMHIAETKLKDNNLFNVVRTMFSEMNVVPIMHELVYRNELYGGADSNNRTIALKFFSNRIITQKMISDFLDSPSKRKYYVMVVKKLYYDFKGPLPQGVNDILNDWASNASLGETHTMAMCAMINCGVFLSDDKGSDKLAKVLKNRFAFDVQVLNREKAIRKLAQMETSIKKHDRNALKHISR